MSSLIMKSDAERCLLTKILEEELLAYLIYNDMACQLDELGYKELGLNLAASGKSFLEAKKVLADLYKDLYNEPLDIKITYNPQKFRGLDELLFALISHSEYLHKTMILLFQKLNLNLSVS